ncbi:MAG: ABC transporter substrate-binding protein, partial [Clostridiales bacterium]|nr:ABC transporter substrate-binding protein [Clostridiales bacterium]
SQNSGNQNTAQGSGTDNVTITEPTDNGGQTKPSGEGGSVETITDKYADFLEDGVGKLYPCQVCYIYVEGNEDYKTFSRGSDEHKLVMQSGCYNIAEKLGKDTSVDDEWIIKKNPELIVKFVSSDVLGSKAENTDLAKEMCNAVRARPGWGSTRAVVNNQILILSKELMDSDNGKLVAKLYIASTLYPTLFSGLDLKTMCNELLGDGGIYVYYAGDA